MNWDCRYHRGANAGLYKIDRGYTAKITERIRELAKARDPTSEGKLIEETSNKYWLEVSGHFVEYMTDDDDEKLLIILSIE